ncbi:hypothetical protein ACFQI3_11220 [Hansschlegelia quercus]|uniref:Uncharacterized protein n=1 Tax=Hansschlegelia quercus TaxID=2528245 RepID=A0A4Q9G9P2_9HYPH|nr:hypothetical protein [Hansschlegelia quercus]TBN47611.1 hypothetical protein EYR15_15755 [Hansschlegelia quercus]
MSNDDVNAVVLRLALTLQRCGEDPRVVFGALIGAAATIAPDAEIDPDDLEQMRAAVETVMTLGALPRREKSKMAAVIPFRPTTRVA